MRIGSSLGLGLVFPLLALPAPSWVRSARSASTPPAEAKQPATAAPVWQRVASSPRFGWIEPRALVTSTPPSSGGGVRDVLQWSIPMQLGNEPLRVTGAISWTPRVGDVARVQPNPPKR
jgi:hypothetical protein